MDQLISLIAVAAIPVLFAITVHEASHAFAASYFGDQSAKMLGRLSLNPVKHIDPIGTIALPLLSLLFGGFLFGWAKPVPVNQHALRSPQKDMFWVAAAGPLSNLAMAFGWGIIGSLAFYLSDAASPFLIEMARIGVSINLFLMVFNLLPLPPLDGFRMIDRFLPSNLSYRISRFEQYGLIIVFGLAISGALFLVTKPIISWLRQLIQLMTGF
jgi:Zn-dependent protease